VGPNGAGKTTLLKIIAGILRKTSGIVSVQGSTFYVPENPASYDNLSASEHFDLVERCVDSSEIIRTPKEVLDLVGLPHKKKIFDYSKGMKRRLNIGMSLIAKREIMLLDEPFEGLDPSISEEISTDLKKLDDGSRIIILSSHDLARVEDLSDVIIFLKAGSIMLNIETKSADSIVIKVPGGTEVTNFLEKLHANYDISEDEIIINVEKEKSQDIIKKLVMQGISINEMKTPSLLETYRKVMEK
jgi:ABC-2 type transport system ATP-binding protein